MLEFNYLTALYRKNNDGAPCFWTAKAIDSNNYTIMHGIVGGKIIKTNVHTHRNSFDEIQSKIRDKRKQGYRLLNEVKDNMQLPVEGELISYLKTYLPDNRAGLDGVNLVQLAKVYDNTNNKMFKKISSYLGQWKINGLRCSVRAEIDKDGLFECKRLVFRSREGIEWNSLRNLEGYLLANLPEHFIDDMIDYDWELDGEIYLPGYSVNEINHFVKDPNCIENSALQYWIYDIKSDSDIQCNRLDRLQASLYKFVNNFELKEQHLSNLSRIVVLPYVHVSNDALARRYRDDFIDLGFEGLILRDPNADYQFGKRNSAMYKFKRATDGKFKIVNIISEGVKRPDIPLFICKNDINEAEFEVHLSGSLEYQKSQFKDSNIGRYMFIEYGERSGVNEVPFHVKTVTLL